jgi:hypothetical protein
MRAKLWLFAVPMVLIALAATVEAQAQADTTPQSPTVEIFGGYSYMHAITLFSGTPINLNGASFSVAFYVNNWLGMVGDVGVYHQGDVANGFSLTLSSYQFGPRLRLRNHTHLTPYGQFLLGGGHAGGSLYTSSLGPGLTPIGANNSFVFTTGGGVDWRLNHKVGICIVQAEYLYSEFLNGSTVGHKQNNLRVSTGVVFYFRRH